MDIPEETVVYGLPTPKKRRNMRRRELQHVLASTSHPPEPCGIRIEELGAKSSLAQQGGKAIIDNKLIFPSRVSFAHNVNWWVISPSLSQPTSSLILFSPPVPLRWGNEWVAGWAPGCEQRLTCQSVSSGKKTTYEPSSKTLLSPAFYLNFKGMHTHEFENKWNIVNLQ